MKRFFPIFLSVLCLFSLTACGKQSEPAPETEQPAALTEQADDTMHLNMLFSLIGTPDVGVTELLGDGEDQSYHADGTLASRTFTGTTLGVDVTFVVNYNEYGDVTSIGVDFPDVSEEQLSAALTNLTGREPSSDGIWHTETANVSLTAEGSQCRVTLTEHTGEPTEE